MITLKEKYAFELMLYKYFVTKDIRNFDDKKSDTTYYNSFTKKDFYENLYIPIATERELYDKLKNASFNGSIFAICGPSGSGKSTVSIKVASDLASNNEDKLIFIDARETQAMREFDDNDKSIPERFVRDLVMNVFYQDYPPVVSSDGKSIPNKDKIELYYFLLTPDLDVKQKRNTGLYYKYAKYIDEMSELYLETRNSEGQTFKNWFFEAYSKKGFKEFKDIIRQIKVLIDIPEFVEFTIKHLKRHKRIIVWIDNIDAFSNTQQQEIIRTIERIHRNVLLYSLVVVSVREENIYRVGPVNDNFNEPFISKIAFADTDKDNNVNQYGAINVPVMATENLRAIVTKKLRFIHEKYIENIDQWIEDLPEIIDIYSMAGLQKVKDDGLNFLEIKKQWDERNKISIEKDALKLKPTQFEELVKLSDKIVDCFETEKVIFLANNSLKHYQQIHASFLYYLVMKMLKDNLTLNADNYSQNQIITDFLSWIHTVPEPFNVNTFNIIEETANIQINKDLTIGCFLPYLVLTRIWNANTQLVEKAAPDNNPRVSKIIEDLENDFGYKKEEIINAIYRLYSRDREWGRGNFITLRSKLQLNGAEDIDLNTTVRITYRGKVTVGHIINSYGYLKQSIENIIPHKKGSVDINEEIFNHLKRLSKIHLESLLRIRERFNDKNWYSKYLYRYGIPLDSSYVRNDNIGTQLQDIRFKRCLHLESIFDSLVKYFHLTGKEQKRVIDLSAKFHQYLTLLIENKEIKSINV